MKNICNLIMTIKIAKESNNIIVLSNLYKIDDILMYLIRHLYILEANDDRLRKFFQLTIVRNMLLWTKYMKIWILSSSFHGALLGLLHI